MRKKVPVVAPDDTVGIVASMLAKSDVPGVLVVDDGELLGIITESDIVTRKAEVDFPETVSFLGGYFPRRSSATSLEPRKSRRRK